MKRATIADTGYLVDHGMAAAGWYWPGSRPTRQRLADLVRDLLSGSKHFVAVGGGLVAVHVTANPFGEKQLGTIVMWMGSPLLLRAALRWAKSRPGIIGLHAPFTPAPRVAEAMRRMGFEPGQGGYYWWRARK